MTDWVARAEVELDELCVRLGKLRSFLKSAEARALGTVELMMLRHQARCMEGYTEVLGDRLELWRAEHGGVVDRTMFHHRV